MNLLTSGVMSGLVGAHNNVKLAEVPMGIYTAESKKRNPDEAKIKRALGYATDSMKSAMEEAEKAKKELGKAIVAAREQEKAEAEAKIKKGQKDKEAKAENDTKGSTGKTDATKNVSGDKTKGTSDVAGKTASTQDAKSVEVNSQTTDVPSQVTVPDPVTKVYTSTGGAGVMEVGAGAGANISVRV